MQIKEYWESRYDVMRYERDPEDREMRKEMTKLLLKHLENQKDSCACLGNCEQCGFHKCHGCLCWFYGRLQSHYLGKKSDTFIGNTDSDGFTVQELIKKLSLAPNMDAPVLVCGYAMASAMPCTAVEVSDSNVYIGEKEK